MLELRHLRKVYGDAVALDEVSFDVDRGEIRGFVGPNGAGKTTTMRIILGVLAPDAGYVRWDGRDVGAELRRRIGYMPEERGLYPKMRVAEQLVYFARLHGLDSEVASVNAERWMDQLGLSDRREDAVEELSLGNQQRVQLAVAMVHEPDLLVLDEPFSGLDPVGTELLADVLRTEAEQRRLPVIFSSHQLDLVERLCDTVAIVRAGRLVAEGGVSELRSSRAGDRWEVEIRDRADGRALETMPGVRLVGPGLFELEDGVGSRRLLDHARSIGEIERFARHRPSLAELFREAIADDRA